MEQVIRTCQKTSLIYLVPRPEVISRLILQFFRALESVKYVVFLKQAGTTDIPHTRATLNLRSHLIPGVERSSMRKFGYDMKDLWPRLSQQRLVNSKTEVLEFTVKMKA